LFAHKLFPEDDFNVMNWERGCVADQPQRVMNRLRLGFGTAALRR
jgi:hypothetical protein